MIHTTADWATIAPTKPAIAGDGDDPAYKLGDLDELVARGGALRPARDDQHHRHAEVGERRHDAEPHAEEPERPDDVRAACSPRGTTARTRATARSALVGLERAEPAAVPDAAVRRQEDRQPGELREALQGGVRRHQGRQPAAKVAIGETSAQGRDKPLAGVSADGLAGDVREAALAKQPGLKFDAWAHHPYPTSPSAKPLEKVRYPNVTLSTLPHVREGPEEVVPPRGADLDHRVRPRDEAGRAAGRHARPAGGVREAGADVAKNDPNVQMFIWFTFRDSVGQPVAERPRADRRARTSRAYATFVVARAADRRHDDARSRPARPSRVTMYVPYLAFYDRRRLTRRHDVPRLRRQRSWSPSGSRTATLAADQSVTFSLARASRPRRVSTYTRHRRRVNDANGNIRPARRR